MTRLKYKPMHFTKLKVGISVQNIYHVCCKQLYTLHFGFLLGNQKIHTLTKQGKYELRVDISDFNGNNAYAKYSTFSVGNATSNYRLNVAGYRGNAGEL